jgi:hypothetical protein
MSHRPGRWPTFLALLALTAAVRAGDPPDKTRMPAENKALDDRVFSTLREVINRGADLYNKGDHAACYRLYEGSLMTLQPFLEHRPELQKVIAAGFASAERDPLTWRRAFTLRNVIDKIRAEANPKQATKKLPPPDEDKEPARKKSTEKVPVKKKPVEKDPDDDMPPVKKPEVKKPIEKKPEEKKPEEKKPEEKKPVEKKEEKKADEKKPDDELPPPKPLDEKKDDKKSGAKKGD